MTDLNTQSTFFRNLSDEKLQRVVTRYRPFVEDILGYYRLQPADFDDVCQLSLISLYDVIVRRKFDQTRGSFRAYLSQLVRNQALTYFRKQKRTSKGVPIKTLTNLDDTQVLEQSVEGDITSQLSEKFEQAWEAEKFSAAMDELKFKRDRQYQVLYRTTIMGERNPDVAKALGITTRAVESDKYKAKEFLKTTIQKLSKGGDN